MPCLGHNKVHVTHLWNCFWTEMHLFLRHPRVFPSRCPNLLLTLLCVGDNRCEVETLNGLAAFWRLSFPSLLPGFHTLCLQRKYTVGSVSWKIFGWRCTWNVHAHCWKASNSKCNGELVIDVKYSKLDPTLCVSRINDFRRSAESVKMGCHSEFKRCSLALSCAGNVTTAHNLATPPVMCKRSYILRTTRPKQINKASSEEKPKEWKRKSGASANQSRHERSSDFLHANKIDIGRQKLPACFLTSKYRIKEENGRKLLGISS